RPFACLITKENEIIAEAGNQVAQTHDPTAHAEMVAIRAASQKLGTEHFIGCNFYILAHPCPMCLAAMYYCSPEKVVFITTRDDYSKFYVDDRRYFTLQSFYDEIGKPWQERSMPMVYEGRAAGIEVYKRWQEINKPHQ
ncbi:MAG TPA: tRNA-specific adenosine deaminase, partial [Planctomycetaceae bacterium]|nr:tRNA-specific adenosine deaminase [Planctomycetaceae bacterium]